MNVDVALGSFAVIFAIWLGLMAFCGVVAVGIEYVARRLARQHRSLWR